MNSENEITLELLQSVLDNTASSIMLLKPLTNGQNAIVDFEYLYTNQQTLNSVDRDKLNVVGKKASDIVPHLEQDWLDTMTYVYRTGKAVRKEGYQADLGRWITLYYSRIGGPGSRLLSVVFQDISEQIQGQKEIQAARDYAEAILRTSPAPLLVLENDLTIVTGNEAFYEIFKTYPGETEGKHVYEVGNGQWNIPQLRELLEEILPLHKTFNRYEVTHTFDKIGRRTMLLNARKMANAPGAPERIVLVIEDVTELKRTEQALRELNENLEQIVQERTEQLNKLTILQEKEKLNAILLGQEQERVRISEGIHNGIAQLMFAVQSRLQSLSPQVAKDRDILSKALNILNDAIRDARNISFELMPPVLRDFGLEHAIQNYIQRIFSGELSVRFGMELKERLSENLEISIYRVVQEILSNIRKHARASEASLQISLTTRMMELKAWDNGIGFDLSKTRQHSRGLGLQNIENRVKLLNGTVKMISEPGQGMKIEIQIPLPSRFADSNKTKN